VCIKIVVFRSPILIIAYLRSNIFGSHGSHGLVAACIVADGRGRKKLSGISVVGQSNSENSAQHPLHRVSATELSREYGRPEGIEADRETDHKIESH
jgi:hypothetical protein